MRVLGHLPCKNDRMNWDDLRYVLALSRRKTLTGVAQEFGESHSTVGRRMRAIERKLGTRLFDQMSAGFCVTEAGQEVADAAERVETEVLGLQARIVGQDAKLQGKLRVATQDALFSIYGQAFATFVQRYPGIELTVVVSDNTSSLTRREADIALRLTSAPPDELVGRRICDIEFAPYASKALVAQLGPSATLNDYPWLHLDEGNGKKWLDEWLSVNAPHAHVAMRISATTPSLREAIANSTGVFFQCTMEGDKDPRLQRIGPVLHDQIQGCWLLTLPELRRTRRVAAFMDHFATWFPPA